MDEFSSRRESFASWNGDIIVETITDTEDGWYRLINDIFLISEYELEDDDADYYRVEDGVLFSKDMTVLYRYPAMKEGWYYQVPSSVTTIEDEAFMGSYYLREIVIPDSVTTINGAFTFTESCVERIHFPRSIVDEFDIDCLAYLPYIKEIVVSKKTTVYEAICEANEYQGFYDETIHTYD